MIDAPIATSFVSETAHIGFADAVDAAERLAGHTITAGQVHLEVGERVGEGLAGAVWFTGTLHTGWPLVRPIPVDVVIGPWSAGRAEIGLRPLSRLGSVSSLRSRRFYEAAWNVLPRLISALAVRPLVARPRVELPAAA